MGFVRPIQTLLTLDALFEGGRMSVGAISAAYLSSRGLSLAEIASIKSFQAGVFLTCEYPTGLFADIVGRSISLIFSLLLAVVGFFLYFAADCFWFFVAAEILTALSICFWSGAFESFAIERGSLSKTDSSLDRFFHLDYSIKQAGVMIFGTLGGLIGACNLRGSYLLAIATMMLGVLLLCWFERGFSKRDVASQHPVSDSIIRHFVKYLQASFRAGLANRQILPFTVTLLLLQAVIQPLLHFWQILLLKSSTAIGPAELGLIFSASCLAGILSCGLLAKVSTRPFVRTPLMTSILFSFFGLMYFLTGYLSQWYLIAGSLCLTQGLFAVAKSSLAARLNEVVPNQMRASILGLNTTISRLGMIASLSFISAFLQTDRLIPESALFTLFGAITFLVSVIVMVSILITRRVAQTELWA